MGGGWMVLSILGTVLGSILGMVLGRWLQPRLPRRVHVRIRSGERSAELTTVPQWAVIRPLGWIFFLLGTAAVGVGLARRGQLRPGVVNNLFQVISVSFGIWAAVFFSARRWRTSFDPDARLLRIRRRFLRERALGDVVGLALEARSRPWLWRLPLWQLVAVLRAGGRQPISAEVADRAELVQGATTLAEAAGLPLKIGRETDATSGGQPR